MVGLRSELDTLLRFLLVLVLFNMTAASFCLLLSIIFKDVAMSNLIATLIMLFQMLFGGLMANSKTIPDSIGWVQNLSFFRYAFEALVVNEVSSLWVEQEEYGLKINVSLHLIIK